MLDRRRFLQRSLALAPLLLPARLRAQTAAADHRLQTISILHTTDLHGNIVPTTNYEGVPDLGGLARCATQIRRWREEVAEHLLLDIGDVYQGTEVSHAGRGQLMIDLLGRLGYHAWTVGNHEFDWGHEVLLDAIRRSAMPVLGANFRVRDQPVGFSEDDPEVPEAARAWANLQPSLVRDFGRLRVGVFGVCTPALPTWLPPELRGPLEVLDPVEVATEQVARLRGELDCQIIVCCAHMGLRGYAGSPDDHANKIGALIGVDGIDLILGGHTHQDFPHVDRGGVTYSQAGYWGISCGRADLTWDHEHQRLHDIRCQTRLMDNRFAPDPLVLELAREQLDASAARLDAPIGTLGEELSTRFNLERPCGVSRLIAEAIASALDAQGTSVDAVVHGSFTKDPEPIGEKTLADAWRLVPYENAIVTLRPTVAQLKRIVHEAHRNQRDFVGLGVDLGARNRVLGITDPRGERLDPEQRVTIAVNAFDAQSAGKRLPRLAEAVADPANERRLHGIQTREALIELFARMRTVILEPGPAAAGGAA